MAGSYLDNLSKGLILEKSNTFLPWKTVVKNLHTYGAPHELVIPGKRILRWAGENIFNGLKADLIVIYSCNLSGRNQILKEVSAYISESDFEKARIHLKSEFAKAGKYQKLNRLEYQYKWQVDKCEVSLDYLDRFGTYYKLNIKYNPGGSPLIKTVKQYQRSVGGGSSNPALLKLLMAG